VRQGQGQSQRQTQQHGQAPGPVSAVQRHGILSIGKARAG
jgi:hypothetical protein